MQNVKVMEIVNLSTSDWPGQAATVIFFQGCPLACPRCHNQRFEGSKEISLSLLKKMLEENSKVLDAVVFSGGEALTYYKELAILGKAAQEMGLLVGLETSGVYPFQLNELLKKGVLDKVFLDLKGPLFEGPTLNARTGRTGYDVSYCIAQSLTHLLGNNVPLELRATVFPDYPTEEEIMDNFREVGTLFKNARKTIEFRLLRGMPVPEGDAFEPMPIGDLRAMADRIGKKLWPVFVGAK